MKHEHGIRHRDGPYGAFIRTGDYRISQFTTREERSFGHSYGYFPIYPSRELGYEFLIPSSPVEPETPILAMIKNRSMGALVCGSVYIN